MEKIAVLLSTYNGEKYLKTQIDSILNQKGVEVFLFIRDDGSSDTTKNIIKYYEENYKNIKWINKNENLNLGFKNSFFTLLEYANENLKDVKYFSLADQDDYWLENKLIAGINKIKYSNNEKGALYFSNKIYYYENTGDKVNEQLIVYNDLTEIFFRAFAFGCTMIFNKKLLMKIVKYKPTIDCYHDSWIYRLSKVISVDIIFDNNAYIEYRIHSYNVCGVESMKEFKVSIKKVSNSIHNILIKKQNAIKNMVKHIYDLAKDDIPDGNKKIILNCIEYNDSFIKKLKFMFNKEIKKRPFKIRMLWKYRVLFNKV